MEAALALLAGEGDGGADTLRHEIHETLDDPLVRIDAGAGQHLATVLGARPAGNLVRTVA